MVKGIVFGAGFMGKRISEYMGYDLRKFNVLNKSKLEKFLDMEHPDVVINCVGKTGRPNIDWCETHKEDTVLSNIAAPLMLGAECSKRGIYMVHLGSGCIYNGYKNGYGFTEVDDANFFGEQFYGDTKIYAEDMLKDLIPGKILQLRIRMPIDDRPDERNLIDKLKKYSKLIKIGNSMTTIPHALPAIKWLIEKKSTGIYNVVNPGMISAGDIMEMYKEIVDPTHEFEVMSHAELDRVTVSKRSNCKLNMDKLKLELRGSRIWIPEIHGAVRECLIKYKENMEISHEQKISGKINRRKPEVSSECAE
ncbi:MAG: sugar nucleotide-binding protein [archaeon]|nr:sugar nucleotide-binding protein [archaeon]